MGKGDETSIWKKEISFRRKRKEPETVAPAELAAPAPEKTSIWKKEITLGRKPKQRKAEESVAPAPAPPPAPPPVASPVEVPPSLTLPPLSVSESAPVAAAPAEPVAPAPEKPSIWKKEITLGRKREQHEPAPAAAEPKPEKTSIWKKEITLGRKPKPPELEEPVAAAPEPAPPMPARVAPPAEVQPSLTLPPLSVSDSAPVEAAPVPKPEPVPRAPEKTSIWKKEITLGRKREEREPEPAGASPEKTSIWKKEITLGRKPKQAKESVAAAPPAPAPVAPPVEVQPSLTLPPLSVSESAPVAAAPAEAVAPKPEKPSIWKKEITLGRKAKQPEPEPVAPAPEKPSIWKKEITLGRKAKQPGPEPVASAPEKTSIWKKEITLGRKRAKPESAEKGVPVPAPLPLPPKPESVAELLHPAGEPEASPVAPPVSAEPSLTLPPLSVSDGAPGEAAPGRSPVLEPEPVPRAPEKTSIWKKEITLGRKAKQPEPEPAVPAPEKTSIWKKEITLGRKAKQPEHEEPVAPAPEPERASTPAPLPPVSADPSLTLPPLTVSDSAPVEAAPARSPVFESEPVPRAPEKTSIWKKEITLGRKPKQPEREPAGEQPEKTSIWKKEITLGRKRSKPAAEEKGVLVPAPLPAPPKPDSVAELLRPVADAPQPPPASPPPAAEASADPGLPLPPVSPSENTVAEPLPPLTAPPPPPPQPPAAAPPPPAAPPAPPPPVLPPMPAPERVPAGPGPLAEPSDKEDKEAPPASEDVEDAKAARKAAKRQASGDPAARRHKRVVGLKIGGSQIAAADVVNNGTPRLNKLARVGLERGIIVGGEVREVEELAAVLKTFFRENKLPRKSVRLGISNNRIGVRTFEISGIDDSKQLANAIRFRAQETLPIPLDEAVLDYRILKDTIGEDGVRTRRVLLVVAHRDLVDRYVSACTKAGLRLVGIDLEAFALLRALGPPNFSKTAEKDAGLVVVSLGFDRSTLAVSDGRICDFTRVIPWGGSSLDVAVARVLGLAPSEAEPVKQRISLLDEGDGGGLEPARADAVRQALRAEVQTFARELVASLRYYQEQPESLGIAEIVLAGGTSQCHGLAEELSRIIGVTVRLGDPFVRLKTPRRLRKRLEGGVGSFATAVGLGIED